MANKNRGFTLLEILIALAIFALLAVMAYGGLSSVLRTREVTESRADALNQLVMVYRMMQRDIEQLVPRRIRDEFGDVQQPLVGGSTIGRVIELTHGGWRNPIGQQRSTLQRVAYRIDDEGTLIREYWVALDRAQDAEPLEQELLEGVKSVEFRFVDADNEWQTEWPPARLGQGQSDDQVLLPLATEVNVDLEDWGEVRWLFRMPANHHPNSGA
jgi:general secretion pathway protein J